MNQNALLEEDVNRSVDAEERPGGPFQASRAVTIVPQGGGGNCGCNNGAKPEAEQANDDNGDASPAFVYAVGQIEPRFPSLGVEKEFAQATGRAETAGLSDRQALQSVLSEKQNRYLTRLLCWVFSIEGIDTYLLMPRDPLDYDMLADAIRPVGRRGVDTDVVIGVRGGIAPSAMCNGLMIPIVAFDQIYSFDSQVLLKSIPRPKNVADKDFAPRTQDLYNRIVQVADNAGATDEHRALNYLATRYPDIYTRTSDAFAANFELAGVDVQPSRLSSSRRIVTVVFNYNQRGGGAAGFFNEQYFVRVDVTEEFPFLVSPLQRGFMR